MRVRPLIPLALALVAWMAPCLARADTSVAVLGIHSVEGDEQAAGQITAAIRVGVGTISGYDLLPSDATLAQMVLAHDCDEEPNEACLGTIASTLGAERLVFGQLRRVSVGASNYRFQLTLSVFNRATSRTERTFRQPVERTASPDALREVGRSSARQLLGVSATGGGTIVVRCSVLAATVQLDGQTVGQTRDDALVLRGVPEGRHQLAVTAPGRRAYTRAVQVEGGESVDVTAELPVLTGPTPYDGSGGEGGDDRTRGGSDLRWLGWVGVGIGVVAGAVAIFSYVQWADSGRSGNETVFDGYTGRVCRGDPSRCTENEAQNVLEIDDVCAHAESTESPDGAAVLDICSSGDTYQVVQIVAMGVGVVALTAGVIGILTLGPDDSSDSSGRAGRASRHRADLVPRLTPVVSPQGAGLTAHLTF